MIDKVAVLRRTELFSGLNEQALRALAARAHVLELSRGEVLFVGGDQARGLYVIVEGSIRAFRESLDGHEQVIHVEGPGATIAEVPVFDDGPYPSTASAEENSVVIFIDKHDIRRLCLEYPSIALAALRILAGRLRRTAQLVETLSLQQVDQRLARFLLSEARPQGASDRTRAAIELVLTNQQIAARIGTVREVVSRALGRLQENGLIRVEGRSVTILDADALQSLAGQ